MYTQTRMDFYCSLCHGRYEDHRAAIACEEWETSPKPCEPGDAIIVKCYSASGTKYSTGRAKDVKLKPLWEGHPGHAWHVQLEGAVPVGPNTFSDIVLAGSVSKEGVSIEGIERGAPWSP